MKKRHGRANRTEPRELDWLFPVVFLSIVLGLLLPCLVYRENHEVFLLEFTQVLPAIALFLAGTLVVGVGLGFLILHWQQVREGLGEYYYLAAGTLLVLAYVAFVQTGGNMSVTLVFWFVLAGLLFRKWEHKYAYLIYGVGVAACFVFFVRNGYPLLTVVVWGAVLGLLLKNSIRPIDVYADIVFGLTLAICSQVLLSNQGMRVVNSSAPRWDNQSTEAVLSLHLWGLCMILPSVLRLIDARVLEVGKKYGSVALTIALVVALGASVVTTDLPPIRVITKDDEFTLSAEENTIVFAVDSLDARWAEQYLSGVDVNASFLNDFTYFSNVVSGGAPAEIGLPTLFTGMIYDAKYEDLSAYREAAYDSSGLFAELQSRGYDVNIFAAAESVEHIDLENVNNIRSDVHFKANSFRTLVKDVANLAAYYAVPYQIKPTLAVTDSQVRDNIGFADEKIQSYDRDDVAFFNDFQKEGLSVNDGRKAFIVYNLNGMNAVGNPYEELDFSLPVEEREDPETYIAFDKQIESVFDTISIYIEGLKEMDLYDSSTIIIVGSSGGLELGQNPAVFIKRKNAHGGFIVNAAPRTFANLRATFAEGIVPDATTVYGFGMFNQPITGETEMRTHVAARNVWQKLYQEETGRDTRLFRITGDARGQKNILKMVETEPYAYTLGEQIALCGEDMEEDSPISGLSYNEGDYCWTQGQDVTFALQLEEPQGDVVLEISYAGVLNSRQHALVYVNEQLFYDEVEEGASAIRVFIPRDTAPEALYNIVLKLPDAVSPAELWDSADERVLALQLTGIAMYAAESYTPAYDEDVDGAGEPDAAGEPGMIEWDTGNTGEPETVDAHGTVAEPEAVDESELISEPELIGEG